MDTKLEIGDLVRFTAEAQCEAAKFCHVNQLTGKIVDTDCNLLVIDAGLCYTICVQQEELELAVKAAKIPAADSDDFSPIYYLPTTLPRET